MISLLFHRHPDLSHTQTYDKHPTSTNIGGPGFLDVKAFPKFGPWLGQWNVSKPGKHCPSLCLCHIYIYIYVLYICQYVYLCIYHIWRVVTICVHIYVYENAAMCCKIFWYAVCVLFYLLFNGFVDTLLAAGCSRPAKATHVTAAAAFGKVPSASCQAISLPETFVRHGRFWRISGCKRKTSISAKMYVALMTQEFLKHWPFHDGCPMFSSNWSCFVHHTRWNNQVLTL